MTAGSQSAVGNWQEIVRLLDLSPHPEGGFYRETFRDTQGGADGRAGSTAIYFLLPGGVISRWHRVDAAEVWHWYAGAALTLSEGGAGPAPAAARDLILGNALTADERPQHVIPAGVWQQAQSSGAWTLVGCTVAPGFMFEAFEIFEA